MRRHSNRKSHYMSGRKTDLTKTNPNSRGANVTLHNTIFASDPTLKVLPDHIKTKLSKFRI